MDNKKGTSASRLDSNHEIIGTLHAVQSEDNCCKLQFSCNYDIELPPTAIPADKLKNLVGKKIGLINIDERFFIRQID